MELLNQIPKDDINEILTSILRDDKRWSLRHDLSIDCGRFEEAMETITDKLKLANEFTTIQPIYYDSSGTWWLWDYQKSFWQIKDEVDIMNYIYKTTKANTINSKERAEILQILKQVGRANKPKDAPKTWIQFSNGIIDIENPENKILATPEYFITNPIPWELSDNEDTPTMDKIFEEWVGKDNSKVLYEILAYCLLPDYPIHRLFCFIGGGMNGKSCYLNLLKKFIGLNNVTTTELDVLLTSRFEITKLHKKLVCQMGETNFSEISKTSILKKLTGGDLIGFEYKNRTPFEDVNYAKIIISTNSLPSTSDKTIGFYRRWMIIDFPNQFTESKDILAEIPDEEYKNLARKCVRILKEIMKNRTFSFEGSVEERMKRYEDRSNYFDKFWNDYVVEDSEGHITKRQFSEKFKGWCKECRHREMSDVSIAKIMKEKGILDGRITMSWGDVVSQDKIRPMAWMGVRWK